MNKIKVGLIGYGVGGKVFHEPFISTLEEFELVSVYTTNQTSINELSKKYHEGIVVGDVEAIFNNKKIELVIVATPNHLHYEFSKKALLASKHVLVEKPFTPTTDEALELIELAKKVDRIITVYHNRRFDSDFKTVKKVIDCNLLGEIVEYEAHFDRYRNVVNEAAWKEQEKPGSGLLYDLGSHLIDQALTLFGLPNEVFACLLKQRPGVKTIDNFEVILKYDQIKVTLKAGMLVRELEAHFKVLGINGTFIKAGMDSQEAYLRRGLTPLNYNDWGKEDSLLWGKINSDINGCHIEGTIESEYGDYRELYLNLYQAIRNGKPLAITSIQAYNTIKVIELAYLSDQEKRWVKFKQ